MSNISTRIGLEPRSIHTVAEPGALEGRPAERVGARPGEGMPIGDGEAEVVLQPLAEHEPIRVVPAVGEGGFAVGSFVADRLLVAEKAGAHDLRLSLMAG